ncbi:MAG TPA: oligosaccharide flippase family protein [Ignavibacteriaceae bacterium]|nr:oligosaccharide flippase family protein [Ignavibacteriaceae bacterium]
MKNQLLLGSLSGTIQIIVNTILIFITIPIFIDKLGLHSYSIFSLLLLFNNLNVFVNLGLNTSLIKYVAEQGKSIQSNYDIAVSFIMLSLILIPISALTIFFNDIFLINLFNIERIYITPETTTLFNYIIISNCFLLLGQIFSAVLDAQQKVYLNNFALILYNFLYWGLILLSLFQFPSFTSISYSILTATLIWFVFVYILFKRSWGSFRINGLKNNFLNTLKKQLSYGVKLYISGAISFFHEPITKLLISHFVGLNEVAFFDIAVRVKNQIWNLISRVFYPLFPFISKVNDINLIKNLIHTVEQKTVFLMIPVMITFIFISTPFVSVWIGTNVDIISTTMIFITSAYLVAIIVIPAYQFLMAKGYPEKTIIIQLLNVIVNTCLFFLTLPWLGYYAAVVSGVGSILSSFILTLYFQKKYLNSLIFDDFGQLGKSILIFILNIILGLILSEIIGINILKILLIPLFLITFSVWAFRILRIFTNEEINKFTDSNSILFKIANKILIKK